MNSDERDSVATRFRVGQQAASIDKQLVAGAVERSWHNDGRVLAPTSLDSRKPSSASPLSVRAATRRCVRILDVIRLCNQH